MHDFKFEDKIKIIARRNYIIDNLSENLIMYLKTEYFLISTIQFKIYVWIHVFQCL